jgi:hypothetical protein
LAGREVAHDVPVREAQLKACSARTACDRSDAYPLLATRTGVLARIVKTGPVLLVGDIDAEGMLALETLILELQVVLHDERPILLGRVDTSGGVVAWPDA